MSLARRRNKSAIFALPLIGLIFLAACSSGDGGGSSSNPPPPSQNQAPAFTSPTSASTAETSSVILTAQANDPEGSPVSYSLSGTDADDFIINAASGLVRARFALDYENPADANQDNIYQITVNASDGAASATQAVTITITNTPGDGYMRLRGAEAGDAAGYSLAGLGDMDGEGSTDLAVGLRGTVDTLSGAAAYLLFGEALSVEENTTVTLGAAPAEGVAFLKPFVPGTALGSVTGGVGPGDAPVLSLPYFSELLAPLQLGQTTLIRAASRLVFDGIGAQLDLEARPSPANATPLFDTSPGGGFTLVGDFDGDGVTDGLGAGYLISGTSPLLAAEGGLNTLGGVIPGEIVLFENDLPHDSSSGVNAMHNAGDINGDGADDLLLIYPNGADAFINVISGRRLFDDADGEVLLSELSAPDLITIIAPYSASSLSANDGGDLDGDGRADIAFIAFRPEAPGPSGANPETYVFFGAALSADADGSLSTADLPNPAGAAILTLGGGYLPPIIVNDLDADGKDELLISETANPASFQSQSVVHVIRGAALAGADQPISFDSLQRGDEFVRIIGIPILETNVDLSNYLGLTATVIRDIDSDGRNDLVIAAPFEGADTQFNEAEGAVYIIPSSRLGNAFATGDDIDLGEEF